MKINLPIYLAFTLFIFGCTNTSLKNKNKSEKKIKIDDVEVVSTEHFRLSKRDSSFVLTVKTPFVGSKQVETYLLSPTDLTTVDNDFTHTFKIPLQKVAINSTTHLGYLAALDKIDAIKGSSNLDLAYNKKFQKNVTDGYVVDLGKQHFDQELLLESNPNALFAFAISAGDFSRLEDYRRLGQKVVLIAEYMEGTPLDKAKWMVAFSAFFGKKEVQKALKMYKQIEHRYDSLKKLGKSATQTPSVLLGLPWKGTWYMGGGNSFQAKFLADANAAYIMQDDTSKGSLPLAIESVFEKGISASYWLNPGAAKQKESMLEIDERFKAFSAFENNQVYNINKRINEAGGNDYWESAVVKPDVILADLIQIFHPELMPAERDLYYYQKLK